MPTPLVTGSCRAYTRAWFLASSLLHLLCGEDLVDRDPLAEFAVPSCLPMVALALLVAVPRRVALGTVEERALGGFATAAIACHLKRFQTGAKS